MRLASGAVKVKARMADRKLPRVKAAIWLADSSQK